MRELLERNRNFVKDLVQQNPWFRSAAYLLAAILLLICLGFRALPIACCLCSTFFGVSIAMWIANASDGRFLYAFVQVWISSNSVKKAEMKEVNSDLEEERKPSFRRELKVPVCVNDAAESLLDQLIDTYVNNWYEYGINRDSDFLNEIRYQIRFAYSQLVTTGVKLDLPTIVAEDVVPIASLHMHRMMKCEDQLADKVADCLVTKLVDDTHFPGRAHDDECPSFRENANMSAWPSQSVRHFLRELVVNALLLPCLDLLADPDTISLLLIMIFDARKGEEAHGGSENEKREATFLSNFAESSSQTVRDSLLHLRLSEVLRDARQYSTFRLYLQDTEGPVNELCFLAEVHDSMQRKAESSGQIAYDKWQLFEQFVHDNAPERIEFDPEIIQEFKNAIECNNLALLDKVIETVSLDGRTSKPWLDSCLNSTENDIIPSVTASRNGHVECCSISATKGSRSKCSWHSFLRWRNNSRWCNYQPNTNTNSTPLRGARYGGHFEIGENGTAYTIVSNNDMACLTLPQRPRGQGDAPKRKA